MAMQILRSGEFKADILQPPDDERFITGDQPIVNALGVWNPEGAEAMDLELYYPVSPTQALLISKQGSSTQRKLTPIETNIRNASMAKAAHTQVYSWDPSDLDHVTIYRGIRHK